MRLSTRGRYGLRAMLDLALHAGEKSVNLRDVSARQTISSDYLEQLLRKLRKAGLVTSVRGPRGGFRLARKPKDISVWEIVEAVEPEVAPVHCVDAVVGKRAPRKPCARMASCATHRLWAGLAVEIRKYLESRTLHDIVEDSRVHGDYLLSREPKMYHI